MSTNEKPICASCGADAEWEAIVKATGPKGTKEENVDLCDPCMARSMLALADAATDAGKEIELGEIEL